MVCRSSVVVHIHAYPQWCPGHRQKAKDEEALRTQFNELVSGLQNATNAADPRVFANPGTMYAICLMPLRARTMDLFNMAHVGQRLIDHDISLDHAPQQCCRRTS